MPMPVRAITPEQLATLDDLSKERRIAAQRRIAEVVKEFGIADVHRWLSQEAAVCCEPMPCRAEEGQ